jgi:hypothetical protein
MDYEALKGYIPSGTHPMSQETPTAPTAAPALDSDALAVRAPALDSVVRAVLDQFIQRAEFGKKKYGTDLDREDLSVLDWIQHAQEEHMDAILYLEKLKRVYRP